MALDRVPSLEAALDLASTSASTSTMGDFSPVGTPVRPHTRAGNAIVGDAERTPFDIPIACTCGPRASRPRRPTRPHQEKWGSVTSSVTSSSDTRAYTTSWRHREPRRLTGGVVDILTQADVVAAAALVASRVENAKARAAAKVANAKTARERAIIQAQVRTHQAPDHHHISSTEPAAPRVRWWSHEFWSPRCNTTHP
jgi:hypothetical protein